MAKRSPRGPLVPALLFTVHALEARIEGVLAPLGLSLAKVTLMGLIADAKGPVALRTLAEHKGCVRSNITQLVDRLEKEGLVRRERDAGDRRSVLASLTPAGERAHAKGAQLVAREHQAIAARLSHTHAAGLAGALKALTPAP